MQDITPPDLHSAALMIEHYARENGLTPSELCQVFNAGIAAAGVLAPRRYSIRDAAAFT